MFSFLAGLTSFRKRLSLFCHSFLFFRKVKVPAILLSAALFKWREVVDSFYKGKSPSFVEIKKTCFLAETH